MLRWSKIFILVKIVYLFLGFRFLNGINEKWVYDTLFLIHSFPTNSFFYLLKKPKGRKFFWCFQGVEKDCIGKEWVKYVLKGFLLQVF